MSIQSIGWERALQGSVLNAPQRMDLVSHVLPSDFTGPHQTIWAEMLNLHARGGLGTRALVETLRSKRELGGISFDDVTASGERYVASLVAYAGDEIEEYANRILGFATKRELAIAAALARADADNEAIDAEEALDNAERRIARLRRHTTTGMTSGDLMSSLRDRIHRMDNDEFRVAWSPAVDALGDMIYAEDEDYIIIAARPGDGKSHLLRYELVMHALSGSPALLINMENSQIEIARAIVSAISGVSAMRMKIPHLLGDADRAAVNDAIEIASSLPLHVVTLGSPNAVTVERVCRKYIMEQGVRLIAVDYVQMMRNGNGTAGNRVDDISISSAMLRSIPLNYKVPVLAAAQLSRAIETRGPDTEPELSDLRDSGSLEQDATIVVFPRKIGNPTPQELQQYPENYGVDGAWNGQPRAVPVQYYVKKNRNGPPGVSKPTLWDRAANRYRSLTQEEVA